MKIRFAQRTGHQPGSLWFVSYGGPAARGIHIGHGLLKNPIENVTIRGLGTIDLNSLKKLSRAGWSRNKHLRADSRPGAERPCGKHHSDQHMRSVMCYGEHMGTILPGGGTEGGESYDAESIIIVRTRTLNLNCAGYLLGHPSHRGQMRNVKCIFNYIETCLTAIEPNFNLDGYEVLDNVNKSDGQAIHCWRYSKNGIVADNLRMFDISGKPAVIGSPRGWQPPEVPV